MKKLLNIYKPVGWTPLEAIEKYRELHAEYRDVKMTYAGRLDPMAEGVLIVLCGDEVHKKETYMKLDKQYQATLLVGVETDTYDALGLIQKIQKPEASDLLLNEVRRFQGSNLLPVPPYSSYKVNGKPLFYWARQGKLGELQLPKRTMNVFDIEVKEMYSIPSGSLLATVFDKINRVHGDFRQDKIKTSWSNELEEADHQYPALDVQMHVASGTYVRAIAHELGCRIGTGAILLHLTRTAVGKHTIDDAERVDL